MTYLLIGLISLVLVSCTFITVRMPNQADPENPIAVSIQAQQSVDVLGSQNADHSPKAARGDAGSTDSKGQTAKTTSVIPITTTPTIVPK